MRSQKPLVLVLAVLSLFGLVGAGSCGSNEVEIPGLQDLVEVATDTNGVKHVHATNDLDASRAQGYLHARDRLFQMDLTRREASGDLAELLGPAVLPGDIQNKTLGLRRAAARTEAALDASDLDLLQAYADGVNAFIAEGSLPPEYAGLELTLVRPWTVLDSLTAAKASTIYNVWRAKAVKDVIDARLASLGAPGVGSRDAVKALHNLLVQVPYTGVGVSGVDFIPDPAGLSAEERRDLALLGALRTALDALAGPDFANAFGLSTNQDDYRWGRLHRIVFDHPVDASLSIPPQAGFVHLDEAGGLLGLSRDGGYEVVNASSFSGRADGENEFMFGGGPNRRYVGIAGIGTPGAPHGVRGVNVIPGGPSGVPGDPRYATQLPLWLTGDYHKVNMSSHAAGAGSTQEVFVPAP